MDMEAAWALTRDVTKLVRQRKNLLYTFGATRLPYLCLVPDPGRDDEVRVHAGTVAAEPPRITVPGLGDDFDFEGFAEEAARAGDDDGARALPVWLARRIEMPTGKYVNRDGETRTERGPLEEAVERVERRLDEANDIRTAVLTSDVRVWRLSVLLYIASQVSRSAPANIMEHWEHRRFERGTP